jgi:hypothetical protein
MPAVSGLAGCSIRVLRPAPVAPAERAKEIGAADNERSRMA